MKTIKQVNPLFIWFMMIVAGLSAGSITTVAKIAKEGGFISSFQLLDLRYLIAGVILLPIIWLKGELKIKYLIGSFIPSFWAVMNPAILFPSLEYTTASVAILIYAIGPTLMFAYMWATNKAQPTKRLIIGLVIGTIGVALVMLQSILAGGVGTPKGNIGAFFATVCFVVYTITSRKALDRGVATPLSLVFTSAIVAVIFFVPTMRDFQVESIMDAKRFWAVVHLGVISTVVFFLVFQYINKKANTLVASAYAYLQATLGALCGIVVLDESWNIYIIVGAILTFVGSKLASNFTVKS